MERKKEELIALPPVRGKQIFLAFSVYILANGVSMYLWPQIWGRTEFLNSRQVRIFHYIQFSPRLRNIRFKIRR